MLMRPEGYDRIIRNAGDDDVVHLSVHTDFRKTKQFLRLPNMIQQRFLMHELEHLMAIQESGGAPSPQQAKQTLDAGTAAPAEGGGAAPGGAQASEPGATEAPAEGEANVSA
jgi:hypothetical protein